MATGYAETVYPSEEQKDVVNDRVQDNTDVVSALEKIREKLTDIEYLLADFKETQHAQSHPLTGQHTASFCIAGDTRPDIPVPVKNNWQFMATKQFIFKIFILC